MKDLSSYMAKCKNICNDLNIPIDTNIKFKVNSRAKRRWGLCEHNTGYHTIQISNRLLSDEVPDVALESTIIHELIHTCKDCKGHDKKWYAYANIVNTQYPKYNIKRCNSAEEKGLTTLETPISYSNEYHILCEHCNYLYKRLVYSKLVQHPEYYRCGKCGGKLKRI